MPFILKSARIGGALQRGSGGRCDEPTGRCDEPNASEL